MRKRSFSPNGSILVRNAPQKREYKRFERSCPNELWQLDTKGSFIIKGWGRVFPLDIVPARHLAGGLVKIEQKKNLLEIYYDKKLIKTVT